MLPKSPANPNRGVGVPVPLPGFTFGAATGQPPPPLKFGGAEPAKAQSPASNSTPGLLLEPEASTTVRAGVVHGGVNHEEHTWTAPGPLGLKLKARGSDKDSKAGVIISEVTTAPVPATWKGMVLEEVNGQAVSKKSHTEVLALIKGAGRPLTIKVRGTVADTSSVTPAAKIVQPPKPKIAADGSVLPPSPPGGSSQVPPPPPAMGSSWGSLQSPTGPHHVHKVWVDAPHAIILTGNSVASTWFSYWLFVTFAAAGASTGLSFGASPGFGFGGGAAPGV